MRHLIAAAVMFAAASPAFADFTEGKVLAYDRVARIVVMEDHTVWQLSDKTIVPEGLVAGEEIRIDFTARGENGVESVETIERL